MPEPRERPIPFTGESVRAILAGTKTQTRRVVKPQPDRITRDGTPIIYVAHEVVRGGRVVRLDAPEDGPAGSRFCRSLSPPVIPGDRFWVKETFGCVCCGPGKGPRREPDEDGPCDLVYKADGVECSSGWRSGRFMWREASRILLEVVEVRVQRLQEISEEDAAAEGAPGPYPTFDAGEIGEGGPHTYHHGFAEAWDRINRKRAPWASNPWVWAYTLRKLEAPRA